MARITGIKYDRNELVDIMETVSVSIYHWATVTERMETEDGRAIGLHIRDEELANRVILISDLQRGINRIVGDEVKINEQVRNWIASGDVGMIDAEAADCIAQVACYGKLVYA